jgi:hypothetical protein
VPRPGACSRSPQVRQNAITSCPRSAGTPVALSRSRAVRAPRSGTRRGRSRAVHRPVPAGWATGVRKAALGSGVCSPCTSRAHRRHGKACSGRTAEMSVRECRHIGLVLECHGRGVCASRRLLRQTVRVPGKTRRATPPREYVTGGEWPYAMMEPSRGAQVAQAVSRALAETMERQGIARTRWQRPAGSTVR